MRIQILGGLAAMLLLSACQTTSMPAPGTGPISSGAGTVAAVVRGVQNACSFAPNASTVLAVLDKAPGPTTQAIIQAAQGAICAAVAPLSSGPGLEGVTQGYAYGVRVEGVFVVRHHRRKHNR